jgi:hypothetical protein
VIWICAQDRYIGRPHTAIGLFHSPLVQLDGLGKIYFATQRCQALTLGEVLVLRVMLSVSRAALYPVST